MDGDRKSERRSLLGRPVSPNLRLNWQAVILCAIVVALVFTRLWDLGNRAYSHDESTHAWESWKLITGQLNHERVTICSSGILERAFEETRQWAAKAQLRNGGHVIDQEWVRMNLARVYTNLEFLRLINWKVAWTATKGKVDPADASTTKVFGTEGYLDSFRLLMEVMGQRGYLKHGSPEAAYGGHLETLYRGLLILTFGGGTNEIQRDLIGLFGLGLPRIPRV